MCGWVIHIESVLPDHDVWLEHVKECTEFLNICILPELFGRWYTRSCISSNSESSAQAEPQAHQLHHTLKQPKSIAIVKALNRMEMR